MQVVIPNEVRNLFVGALDRATTYRFAALSLRFANSSNRSG